MKAPIKQQFGKRRASLARAVLRAMLYKTRTYQPVIMQGRVLSPGKRGSEERAAAVVSVAADVGATTVLDLGCAEGYIVRRCAEAGLMAIGVDADARRLAAAQWSLTLDNVDGFGFIKARITPETLPRLPDADLTVFLSVLHHIMYEHGEDHAREMLGVIRGRTKKAIVFEMGQSNEHDFAWARLLPDMGSDPHSWIAGLLEDAGFVEVRKVCEVRSFRGGVSRATFAALVPRAVAADPVPALHQGRT